MSTGGIFQVFGPATENACSEETSFVHGTNKSCFAAERSVTRPGMLTTEVTSSVKYYGALPLMAWCTKIQSLKFIRSEFGSQCSSYRDGDTWFQVHDQSSSSVENSLKRSQR